MPLPAEVSRPTRWLGARAALVAMLLLAGPLGAQDGERVGPGALESLLKGEDRVVRRVGPVPLMASDVFRMLDLSAPGVTAEVLEQMVLNTLARLEADREQVDVPAGLLEATVDQALADTEARFALEVTTDLTFDEFLEARHGLSSDGYREELRRSVLASLLLDRVVRLDQFRMARDELQILVMDDEDEARQVATLLAEGASFAALAREHSIHPSAEDGGFMPPLPADIDLPLVAGRERLSEGDWLGPAPITIDGHDLWRLVRLVERSEARSDPWDLVREEVESSLSARPVGPDELAIFEDRMRGRYRVEDPSRS